MKILWFSPTPCGSVRRDNSRTVFGGWLISLEDALKPSAEIDLHVAFFSPQKQEPFDFDGVHYIPMYDPLPSNSLKRMQHRHRKASDRGEGALPELRRAMSLVNPDLIHIHGTEERFGLVAAEARVPVVFSIQGLLAPYKEKYWSGLPKDFVLGHDTLTDRLRGISNAQAYRSFEIRADREVQYLTRARYIFGRTGWDRRVTGLFNPNRKYYQAEELMRGEFYDNVWSEPADKSVMRIVTTMSTPVYKGYETLLHAAWLLKQYAPFDFEWTVIGYGPDTSTVRLTEKFRGLRSSDCNIRLAGRLSAPEMIDIMMNAHVYCNTSHIENSPNNVCEAMLLGMPLIASNAGGTISLIGGDDDKALIYQDGDSYALAGAICEVYANYPEAVERGRRARVTAMRRHDKKAIAESYIAHYKDIIDDFGHSRDSHQK